MKSSSETSAGFSFENRKARFNYELLDRLEVGIVLTGAEVKAIREGKVNLSESFASISAGELWLLNCHISQYKFDTLKLYNPVRKRKLLAHKHEIKKLRGKVEQKGLTLVPVRIYSVKGRAKLELALAKGKNAPDKRETVKARDEKRRLAKEFGNKIG